ncbi:MAG: hypothetical protein RIF32_06790, partial [Leptospirales bacterium]
MAANENRPDPRRLRYFNGLIMKQEEFILEQDYHVRMRRLHNRFLHDGGIIEGLEVTIVNTPNEVLVAQGFALDRHTDPQFSERIGRELYLTDDFEVDLSSYQPGDEVWIWISYAEQEVGIVPDRGGEEPIYIQETVVINHSTNEPPNRRAEDVVLAVVEIGPGGVVDESSIKDTFMGESVRERTAFKIERLSAQVLSLTDPEIADDQTPFLDGFRFEDTGDDGIVVSSDRTRFIGVVDVDTRLNVGTDAAIAGNAQVDQNVSVIGNLTVAGDFAGRLPLGGVVAVFDYGSNLPATTNDITGDGFMRADGQTLPNTTGLYAMADGNALPTDRPDLTNEVFLMGATTSGNVGGANSVTVTIPAHNHGVDDLGIIGNGLLTISGDTGGISFDNGLGSHGHTALNVVDGTFVIRNQAAGGFPTEPNNATNRGTTGPSGSINHGHTLSGGTVDLTGLDVDGTIGEPTGISGDIDMAANAHENRP